MTTSTRSLFFSTFFILAYAGVITFAIPPLTQYTPGETLDPSCVPGDINCSVEIPLFEGWGITGNVGTDHTINFIGTVDDQDIVFRRNDIEIARLYADGVSVGEQAGTAYQSHFFGNNAGQGATNASQSNFLGYYAGYGAINAYQSNFLGTSAGYGAENAGNGNFFGYYAGYGATDAFQSNFIGYQAGYGATDARDGNFLGYYAGYEAVNARWSNFIGYQTGYQGINASYANFFGYAAGYGATDAQYSNFLGYNAGYSAINAEYSNFLGYGSGYNASNAFRSNFFGYAAGDSAANASYSNFLGYNSGYNATDALHSNFLGYSAGYGAANASYSNLFGYQVGSSFSGDLGSNNIIIGTNISLPNATANAMNLGGVLFGTGTYATTSGGPSIIPVVGGRIGIGVVSPAATLDVAGDTILSGVSRYLNFGTITGVSGYGLRDNAGIMQYKNNTGSWIAFSNSVTALGNIGTVPNAAGATITGSVLNLQPASNNFGGIVTTGTQTFAGSKTFTGGSTTFRDSANTFQGYFGGVGNFGPLVTDYFTMAIARDPNTGVFADTNVAAAQINLESRNNSGEIVFYTTTVNNSVPLARAQFTNNGRFVFDDTGPIAYPVSSESAVLQINSTTRGLLIPRMTTTNRDAIISPVAGLQVYNASTNNNNFWNGTAWNSGWNTLGNTGTNPANNFIGTTDSTALVIRTNNIQRMTILSDGRVGINAATPSHTLHVGNTSITGIVARFQNSTGTCDINPTTTALTCSSDQTLKSNITSLDSALAFITQLRPVTYSWTSDSSSTPQVGFIAQEVETVFPSLVSIDPTTGLKSLASTNLIPYTIKALQELNFKLEPYIFEDQIFRERLATFLRGIAEKGEGVFDSLFAREATVETLCVGTKENKTCISKEELDALLVEKNTYTPTPQVSTAEPVKEENPTLDEGTLVEVETESETEPLEE